MASIQNRGGRYQLRIKNKALPRPVFFTFDTEAEAQAYKAQVEALLKRGIVPQALLDQANAAAERRPAASPQLTVVVLEYLRESTPAQTDVELLRVMLSELEGLTVADVTYPWAESYVRSLKGSRGDVRGSNNRRLGNLAPGSIRKRVQSLARVLDWHWRRTVPPGGQVPTNPLRNLPHGYSLYTEADKAAAEAAGLKAKRDVRRDRRLTADEEELIMRALDGEHVAQKQRPLAADPEFKLFLRVILDTGLRLKEAYSMRVEHINWRGGYINVQGSKGHRGADKPRTVPMRSSLAAQLKDWCGTRRVGLVFGYWDGDVATLRKTTMRLTSRFYKLCRHLDLPDLTEHDLRHTACCNWFELRGADGRWVFSDVEICRIMGWSDYSMVLRYASLRGEDLAARLRGI